MVWGGQCVLWLDLSGVWYGMVWYAAVSCGVVSMCRNSVLGFIYGVVWWPRFRSGGFPLVDGYAPFCKHIFVPNFAEVKRTIVPITPENTATLVTGYEARTEKELAVLSRWFPADALGETGVAGFLDIILYSRDQIRKEVCWFDVNAM